MPAAVRRNWSSHSTGGRGSEVALAGVALKSRGVQPDNEMARVKSAGTAATASTGNGFSKPPSASSRPLTMIGAIAPGIATEALIATSTGPAVNQTSRRAPRSVATAV